MKSKLFMKTLVLATLLVTCYGLSVEARSHVRFGFNFGNQYHSDAPVYVAPRPQPVYVYPAAYPVYQAPVVYQPAPVVYQPAPVVYQPAPVYVYPERQRSASFSFSFGNFWR